MEKRILLSSIKIMTPVTTNKTKVKYNISFDKEKNMNFFKN